jgi:hypothetical protein
MMAVSVGKVLVGICLSSHTVLPVLSCNGSAMLGLSEGRRMELAPSYARQIVNLQSTSAEVEAQYHNPSLLAARQSY